MWLNWPCIIKSCSSTEQKVHFWAVLPYLIFQRSLLGKCLLRAHVNVENTYTYTFAQSKLNGMLFIVGTAKNNGFRVFMCGQSSVQNSSNWNGVRMHAKRALGLGCGEGELVKYIQLNVVSTRLIDS